MSHAQGNIGAFFKQYIDPRALSSTDYSFWWTHPWRTDREIMLAKQLQAMTNGTVHMTHNQMSHVRGEMDAIVNTLRPWRRRERIIALATYMNSCR